VLQRLTDAAARIFDAGVAVSLATAGGELVERVSSTGGTRPPGRTSPGLGVTGRCAALRRGIRVDDYAGWPHAIPEDVALGIRHAMAQPLLAGDDVAGVITLSRTSAHPARPFDDEDLALLGRLAAHSAVVLRNAPVYRDVERGRREAEALTRIARQLTEATDVATVGARIVEGVQELFGCVSSGVRLLEPDGSMRAIGIGGALAAHLAPGHVAAPGVGIRGLAIATGGPVWSSDALSDPRLTLDEETRAHYRRAGHGAITGRAAPARRRGDRCRGDH
jgi:GAF domain-containing protein